MTQELCKKLKEIRLAKGYTRAQEAFANAIGYSWAHYNQIENGKRNPNEARLKNIIKLAEQVPQLEE